MDDYFEHRDKGFWLAVDILGIVLCCMAGVCMVAFGWPFYLLSKLVERVTNE